jgi:hypothetical protein
MFLLVNASDGRKRAWKRSCWSLTALYHGKWPMNDDLGRPWPPGSEDAQRAGLDLAGGFRAILYVIKGDLDYLAKSLGLTGIMLLCLAVSALVTTEPCHGTTCEPELPGCSNFTMQLPS